VDDGGNNNNSGLTSASPLASMVHAYDSIPSDTIIKPYVVRINPGTYNEGGLWTLDSTTRVPYDNFIRFEAAYANTRDSMPVVVLINNSAKIYVQVRNAQFRGLEFRGDNAADDTYFKTKPLAVGLKFEKCFFHSDSNVHRIRVAIMAASDSLTVENCIFLGVYNTSGSGGNALGYDGTGILSGWKIVNNTFYKCKAVLDLDGASTTDHVGTDMVFENNLVSEISEYIFINSFNIPTTFNQKKTMMWEWTAWQGGSGADPFSGGTVDTFTANPNFLNTDTTDWTNFLMPGWDANNSNSAINAGDSSNAPSTDFYGVSRRLSNGKLYPDIGAVENAQSDTFTIVFQKGIDGYQDAYDSYVVSGVDARENNGGMTSLKIRKTGEIKIPLTYFGGLEQIYGKTIVDAYLEMYMWAWNGCGTPCSRLFWHEYYETPNPPSHPKHRLYPGSNSTRRNTYFSNDPRRPRQYPEN